MRHGPRMVSLLGPLAAFLVPACGTQGGSGSGPGASLDAASGASSGAASGSGAGARSGSSSGSGASSGSSSAPDASTPGGGQTCDGGACNAVPSGLLNPDYTTTWKPGILADAPTGNALGSNGLPVRTTTCASVPAHERRRDRGDPGRVEPGARAHTRS